jgi:hypothetical protein
MQGKNKEGIKLFLAGVSSPFANLPYLHLLWKQYTGKSKKGDETFKFLIFKLVLTVVLPPFWDLPQLHLLCFWYHSSSIKSCQDKILKNLWIRYPISLHGTEFVSLTQVGDETRITGQTRAPGKGDFKDNSKGVLELLNTLLTLYHHHSVFLGHIFVVFSDKLGIWKILKFFFFNV